MRDEWEMEFMDSGDKALARMAEAHFDVIVSDMRMPGMNGADLLNEVAKLHPATIRIALSGFADRELMLKCVSAAHQYLAKPCDAGTLEAVLLRLTGLVRSKKDESLRQLLARCPVLPSVPKVYSRLVELLNNPECTIEDIGIIVSQDAAMSTQVLKLVNSAFYGFDRKISHPSEAALFLGIDTIKSMVLGTHLFQPALDRLPPGFSVPRLWGRSSACADAARMIAQALGGDRQSINDAYVAGLLHDIGKLLLAANLPDEFGQAAVRAREERISIMTAERAVFGADHAEVGGYYLGLLGLPLPVIDAVTFHHNPSAAADQGSIPLAALHVADLLTCGDHTADAYMPISQPDETFVTARGLRPRIEEWRRTWQTRTSAPPPA
jgi:HD-like signal output (HDOD) protein